MLAFQLLDIQNPTYNRFSQISVLTQIISTEKIKGMLHQPIHHWYTVTDIELCLEHKIYSCFILGNYQYANNAHRNVLCRHTTV